MGGSGSRAKLLLLALLVAALSAIFFHDINRAVISLFFKEKYIFIIGVLSSPDNFQKRASLRNTWLKLTSGVSVAYYFVVGERACNVHPLDRVNEYSCIENRLFLPENVTSETEFVTLKQRVEKSVDNTKPSFSGFGFATVSSVVVKRLGIVKPLLRSAKSHVQVKLLSAVSKKILASVHIESDGDGGGDGAAGLPILFKPIRPLRLEAAAEVQVTADWTPRDGSFAPSCDEFDWDAGPGAVHLLQLLARGERKPRPFARDSFPCVALSYVLPDVDVVKTLISGKEKRRKEWRISREKVFSQLKNESSVYGDLAFVDVVDVYRNLPRKLIQFFKRLVDTEHFHYVLKTDDDSFVDVLRVYRQLLAVNRGADDEIIASQNPDDASRGSVVSARLSKFWWWSSFREFWKVQESGKWRDDRYRSPAYPSFPCGGGYVLSRGIVEYLSENSENLQYFQGEDVSVGIWMSGMNVVQHVSSPVQRNGKNHWVQKRVINSYGNGRNWSDFLTLVTVNRSKVVMDGCDWTCDEKRGGDIPLCNRVQLSPYEMYDTWSDYLRDGYI